MAPITVQPVSYGQVIEYIQGAQPLKTKQLVAETAN